MKKKFRWIKALKKGIVAAMAVGVGLAAGAELLGSVGSIQEVGVIGGASALTMMIRTGLNWWKVNHDLADKTYVR